jgi:hypothetical protein
MTALRDAYPPVGKPVRLMREEGKIRGVWSLEERGSDTRYYQWRHRKPGPRGGWTVIRMDIDETRDAWEAV